MGASVFLSHVLSADTPGYGGKPGFLSESVSAISRGDSSNSSAWRLSSHAGTHVDAPFHFSDAGDAVDQFPASEWIFERPALVCRDASPAELIAPGAWTESIPIDTDLLLLRTGFERFRGEPAYWEGGPGISVALAEWLRKRRPTLRALGVDFLSVTSWQHREEGRKAHRALLNPRFVVIEDMALAGLVAAPVRVWVAPLRVRGADGSPATVIAELGGC